MDVDRDRAADERAVYIISVAAELAGVHPQTLRIYERKGLLRPERTSGNTRRYSEQDIEKLLTTGDKPDGDSVGGAMGKVVGNIARLSAEDRGAMAAYVKSLPPVQGPKH